MSTKEKPTNLLGYNGKVVARRLVTDMKPCYNGKYLCWYGRDYMKKKFVRDYKRKAGETQFSYVGDYYIFHMEETEKKRRAVRQTLFAAVQIILLIAAGFLNSPGSYKAYIVLPYLCMILPLIYYMTGAVGFAGIPEKMEKRQYEVTVFRMTKSVVAVFFLSILTVGADIVFLIRNRSEIELLPEMLFLGIMMLVAVMSYAALRYHNRMQKQVMIEQQKDTK